VTAAMSVGTPETIFKLDTLSMIVAKIGSNMISGFREDFFKVYRRTTSDGNKKILNKKPNVCTIVNTKLHKMTTNPSWG
jgi:hypothetical protein